MTSFELPTLLLEFLAKSAGVIAFGFLLQFGIQRFAPDTRHSFWVYVFSACLGIPLLLFAFPRWKIVPVFGESVSAPPVTVVEGPSVSVKSELPTLVVSDTATPVSTRPDFHLSWSGIFAGIWGIGVFVILLRSAVAVLYLRRVFQSGRKVDSETEQRFRKLKGTLGIPRPVTLLISPMVDSPFTWGITRTRIALPESFALWSPDELEMILTHELEHIRRHDAQAVFVSRLFLALNWINPFAWMANRQAVQLREEACDQSVLRRGYSSGRYAEMLFRQAKYSASPSLQACTTAVAETGTIEKRIKMILNKTTEPDRESSPLISGATGLLIVGAIFVIGISGCSKEDPETKSETPPVSEPLPKEDPVSQPEEKSDAAKIEELENKLKSIIIPSIEFADTPLEDALKFLQQKSVELDTTTEVAGEKGFNIVGDLGDSKDTKITLRLANVPVVEAIRYTTSLAQLKYTVWPHAVVILREESASFELKQDKTVGEESAGDSFNEAYFARLESITIPKVEFVDTPIEDALAFLQMRSRELDTGEEDRAKKGVNIILADGDIRDAHLSLKMSNAPLSEILNYVAALAGGGMRVEKSAVIIGPGKATARPANLSAESKRNIELIEKKLAEIMLPSVEFSKTPVRDALQFLTMKSSSLDVWETDPEKKGINVILESGGDGTEVDKKKTISLRLSNVSLGDAFRYVCEQAGLEYKVEPHSILISPK